ncbi:hypothetical protein F5882DRAFT_313401, partial [Hyaloscypha sp. PMI_1271]
SKIDYLAHVNNLVIKAILESLGLSTYKKAYEFLNWGVVLSWRRRSTVRQGNSRISCLKSINNNLVENRWE